MMINVVDIGVLAVLSLLSPALGQTLLFNGAQVALFDGASTACLNAFNTSLACASTVQLLSYDLTYLAWSAGNLTSLCTPSCLSSLRTLESAVASTCGSYSFAFNNAETTAVQVVDLFIYKYNMSCLADIPTGQFCLVEEQTWNITQLNNSGKATWPTHTNKTYPNWYWNNDGSPLYDVDGTLLQDIWEELPAFQHLDALALSPTGQDLYSGQASPDYSNYGWPVRLEYDEYPLQIQCTSCFVNQFLLGIESQWGEVYEYGLSRTNSVNSLLLIHRSDITSQVWANMQQNCSLTHVIKPANNLTGGLSG